MSSFDENGDLNSVFVDSMMESDEEGRQNLAAKKASLDKNARKRKRKSKWWSHFSVDEEDPTFASCFIEFCKALNPVFKLPSRTTATRDCYALFIEQRNELKKTFKNLNSRAFSSLYMKDSSCFKELRKVGGGPIEDDWKRIYGTRLMIYNISDDDECIKKMAAQMKFKYEKYYGNIDNINIMMFVAVILDPRHKLNYVNWTVHDSYDETQATLLCLKIKMVLQSLFDSYASSMPPSKTSDMSSSTSTSLSNFTQGGTQSGGKIDLQQLMASKFQRNTGCLLTSANKNELDKYLEDACESHVSNFDILQWWKD
ncbi:hypothetical protein F3Y22_tig00110683pilonHSYRG00159 [Hibiscus syriacus]|uniref:hAT-like transposase RNase-H fold domain-containing protein n=1 Tax=Hibiscus syriacus TaxID=106335 RepID=A0A6A2ZV80_HIBSY|nr:hypothetical protein F3Y22_tig00110683pilonHSYRG00159 [Hibiscus syriacus]